MHQVALPLDLLFNRKFSAKFRRVTRAFHGVSDKNRFPITYDIEMKSRKAKLYQRNNIFFF